MHIHHFQYKICAEFRTASDERTIKKMKSKAILSFSVPLDRSYCFLSFSHLLRVRLERRERMVTQDCLEPRVCVAHMELMAPLDPLESQ